nr:MAG TPA: hypothetical protein [Caudoviricetes sp.]
MVGVWFGCFLGWLCICFFYGVCHSHTPLWGCVVAVFIFL